MSELISHDKRIAYGVGCTWWDSIYRVGKTPMSGGISLPCCPFCKSMLFEVPSEQSWFAGVDAHEKDGNPGYRKLIEWNRGKCFKNMADLKKAYEAEHEGNGSVDKGTS